MKEKTIVKRSLKQLGPGQTDWTAVGAQTDEEIKAAIASDPDASPILDKDWFKDATFGPPLKVATSIRVDGDVMAWFRGEGRGWQTRMNQVLRAYAKAHGGVE